jgi:flagellar basal body P-ring formation protein FlgA
MIIRIFVLVVSVILIATALANAQDGRPALRAEANVTGGLVRIGDLVENAGIVANAPVFRAPALGETGNVPVAQVLEALRAHSLVGLEAGSLTHVAVTRASRAIAPQEIEALLTSALAKEHNLGDAKDISLSFDRPLRTVHVEPSFTEPARIAQLRYDQRSGRFDAMIEIAGVTANARLFGSAFATTEVVTLTRSVARGEIIKAGDIAVQRVSRARLTGDTITDPEQVIGLTPRASAAPDRPLRNSELVKPELVQRGEHVTVTYQMPGVMLSVRGKATEGGALGDSIDVVNVQSNRTLRGTITGRGEVAVISMRPRLIASAEPSLNNPPLAGDR